MLGWQDVRQAYRRSALGPFWITAGMAAQIGAMGVVFGIIFRTPLQEYLPFLATSIILWGFIAGIVVEGCMTFISAEAIIKQLNLPLYVHVIRLLWKQLIILGHNIVLLPIVFLVVSHSISWKLIVFVPGLLILLACLAWVTVLLGMLSARYRDMPPIISSLVTIAYFVTPVMWQPGLIPSGTAHLLLGLNPLYHLLQVVRLPFLGGLPTPENWFIASAVAVIGWLVTLEIIKKYQRLIPYWV